MQSCNKHIVQNVALLFIREVLGSNFCPEVAYPEVFGFPQSVQTNTRAVP
jgi:hypothetical protein